MRRIYVATAVAVFLFVGVQMVSTQHAAAPAPAGE